MRIAVNMRLLIKDRLDGIGWFTHESFSRIVKTHPEHEFIFIFDRPYPKEFLYAPNVRAVVIPLPTRHPLLFYFQYKLALPLYLRFLNPDLYISPDGFLPFFTKTKMLAVMHDLNFEHHPEMLPRKYSILYKKWFPVFAKRAASLATVSEYSKNDLHKLYNISPERIDVVYNGASAHFKPLSTEASDEIRRQFTSGKPFFIHIGTLHPRKNIARLLEAWDIFKKTDKADTRLVLAGARMWWTAELRTAWEKTEFKDEVIFTGRIDNQALANLLASAEALLLVSMFEGFGIPIVEAFRCGIAVITSNSSSMPEVAGDAALLVNPLSPKDIAEAMTKIMQDESVKNTLRRKSLERSEIFTWDRTATLLGACIEKAIAGNNRGADNSKK